MFFFYNVDLFYFIFLQHAVGYVSGDQYYGAKASINVWAPKVANQYEFSLSQMWVISGSFGNDLNTIEAGWQVLLQLFVLSFFLPIKVLIFYFLLLNNWP